MKNPNSKKDLIAILEVAFEIIDSYQKMTISDELENDTEKLKYEFLEGSK